MAGTRTAGTVDGTPNAKKVSLHWIDKSGEKRSDTAYFDEAATDAEIEAYVAAAQALSNSSLYKVQVSLVYEGAASSSNAAQAIFEDVAQNLVWQAKLPASAFSLRTFIPSPVQAVTMVGGNSEEPDPATTEMAAYQAALLAVLPVGYGLVGVRFTQRRDINNQVKL